MYELCRACLKSDINTHDLFENDFHKYYEYCTNLDVNPNDGFPSNICTQCYDLVSSYYSFKLMCLQSYNIMKVGGHDKKHNNSKNVKDRVVKSSVSDGISVKNKKRKIKSGCVVCDLCHNKFSSKQSLIIHMKSHGNTSGANNKYFKCNKCTKWFFTEERFNGHLRTHEGKKQAVCEICNKEFTKWSGLKQHMVQHEGEKKYVCDVCGRLFYYKWSLSAHARTHIDVSSCAVCDVCGKTVNTPGNLNSHMKVHSTERPFPCNKCNKSFKKEIHLNEHLLRHNRVKNHICSICEKAFTTLSELCRHTVLHSSERPFACSHCLKKFKRKALLQSHMKIHKLSLS